MKTKIQSLFTALLFALPAVGYSDQVILTVDMSELYTKYNKAIQSQEAFNKEAEKAQQEINTMLQDGLKMAEEYKEFQTKANNPALTVEARKKFQDQAATKEQDIQRKQVEITQFQQQTTQALSQRRQSVLNLHFSDIKAEVAKIAKNENADLVLNSSAGIVLYQKDAKDITSKVLESLNK